MDGVTVSLGHYLKMWFSWYNSFHKLINTINVSILTTLIQPTPLWPFAGIAVDGPNKSSSDIYSNSICLIKKMGKVKALDEELYSGFLHVSSPVSAKPLVFCFYCICPVFLTTTAVVLSVVRKRLPGPGRGALHTFRHCSHSLGHTRRAECCQQPPSSLRQGKW